MNPPVLQVNSLTKNYDGFLALNAITFSLQQGTITLLSGPNGSGKTTLLNCISGLLNPTSGELLIAGLDPAVYWRETRQAMVFVPDVPRFYLELTAFEHLRFIAAANNALEGFETRAEELLTRFGLWEAKDGFPHHYSRGMRLKLGLLMGLIRPAKLLLLDEPTASIDSEGRELLELELIERKNAGMTVLLSSHDSFLAERLGADLFTLHAGHMKQIELKPDINENS
ncbi:MAG: ABC transporter ATP-binding protein [Anaerolineaceae bacterium]